MTTKQRFMDAYRAILVEEYEWARDEERLDKFMASVKRTIAFPRNATWNYESWTARRAWRQTVGAGRYSLTALRQLPD